MKHQIGIRTSHESEPIPDSNVHTVHVSVSTQPLVQGYSHLEMSPVHSDGRLREVVGAYKLYVQGPYSIVLSQRESLQGTVKGTTSFSHFLLVHQKLAVVQPYPRHLESWMVTAATDVDKNLSHLMHEHQRPLEGIVHLIIGRVSHALPSNLLPPQPQVLVP